MATLKHADRSLVDGRWRLLSVTTSREMKSSPAEVWDIISDHTTWTTWQTGYDEHEPLTDRTEGIGATFRTVEWILRSEGEITRWDPGRAVGLTLRRISGLGWLLRSFYSEITIEPAESTDGGCVVHYRVGFAGTVWFWLLSAYTIGQSLGSIYWDAWSSLRELERLLQGEGGK